MVKAIIVVFVIECPASYHSVLPPVLMEDMDRVWKNYTVRLANTAAIPSNRIPLLVNIVDLFSLTLYYLHPIPP